MNRAINNYLMEHENEILEKLKPYPKDIKNMEIDHIIPLLKCNFLNPEGFLQAVNPDNLQWLTTEENNKKKILDYN